jgi:hypothetical protein
MSFARSRSTLVFSTDPPSTPARHNKFSDIDRALEAWWKHPCLRVGGVLEKCPADEEFNARIAA